MKKTLLLFLKSVGNPVTLITFFAPVIVLKINYLVLRDELSNPFYAKKFPELKELVTSNKSGDALMDINIQYVVLLVAFIFTIIISVKGIITLLRNHNHRINDIIDTWSDNTNALWYLAISVLIIFGGIIVFFTGGLVTPEQIELFKLNSANPPFTLWGFHPPPFSSFMFIARAVIMIYAIYLTYFIKNVLPKILDEEAT